MLLGSKDCFLPRHKRLSTIAPNRREQLEELRIGDGRPQPEHLKAQVVRELNRLELLLQQIKIVEAERDVLVAPKANAVVPTPAALLQNIKGIGPEFAAVLWLEGFYC